MKLVLAIAGLVMMAAALAAMPSPALAQGAQMYWQCKTTQPVGWCPVNASTPLPVDSSGGATSDVNITEVGGNPVTTALPTVGSTTVCNSAGTLPPVLPCANVTLGPGTDGSNLNTVNMLTDRSAGLVYNGTNWDFQRGNTSGTFAVGNVSAGAADSGNPVKVGGIHGLNLPTLGAGQRGDLQLDNRGGLYTVVKDASGTTAADVSNSGVDGLDPTTFGGLYTLDFGYAFDGTNWNRDFTCGQTAIVSVAAGATTQIVALSGTTRVRVCSLAVSMSAAGVAEFVSGTGANCATGQTALTGAMPLATGIPLAINGGDGAVLTAAAGHALCVTAVTGNVVGFVTYAQY